VQQEVRLRQTPVYPHLDLAAARQHRDGRGDQVEQEFDLVFGHLPWTATPQKLVLAFAEQAAADLLGRGQIDLGSGRAGGTEREARELQTRGSLLGDIANHVQSVGLGLGVIVLVENLKAVVDGADGADHIVADLARDQRGEFEIGRLGALCHRRPSRS
jgi:hypothetical protein